MAEVPVERRLAAPKRPDPQVPEHTSRRAWLVDVLGLAAIVIAYVVRPRTWRAPVRAQFVAILDREGVGGLRWVLTLAVLTGAVLVSQALFWLRELGQPEAVRDFMLVLLMQQFGPIAVAFILIGRSGLYWLGKLHRLARDGPLRAMALRGVNTIGYVVVPMALALAVVSACLTAVFVAASIISGFLAAELLGLTQLGVRQGALVILETVAASEPILMLVKSLVLGYLIGIVICTTALAGDAEAAETETVISRGFFRALLGVLGAIALLSLLAGL